MNHLLEIGIIFTHMQNREIKVTRNYSFWKHPIKWWQDRKVIKFMDWYANYQWNHGMKEKAEKMSIEMIMKGTVIVDGEGNIIQKQHAE